MSDIALLEKIRNYKENHCYQYQKRLDTLEEDKKKYNLTDEDIVNISLSDYEFKFVTDDKERKECYEFVKRYEWLCSISQYSTHTFCAYWKGIMSGVIIFGMPNSFSNMLGEDTKHIERLIQRGCSISFAHKHLASCFLSWCIRWMVKNTQYRLFTAYSDLLANERGVIYKSLNFYYLGQKSGTTIRCINPYDETKIISDRTFRSRSFYKKYAKDLGIIWQKEWNNDQSVLWSNIPDDIEQRLREYSREMYRKAKKIEFPPKRKWAYVLGKDKRETKYLRKKFLELNKVYEYPKD